VQVMSAFTAEVCVNRSRSVEPQDVALGEVEAAASRYRGVTILEMKAHSERVTRWSSTSNALSPAFPQAQSAHRLRGSVHE
jgi:hypothetical protein